ncbi:MAG TPA: ABC transporter substrate-binding protein [Pseudomonadales bacterium]|nr:ABC transporter substrate-binding protein [Pseudomonadales bacterium]
MASALAQQAVVDNVQGGKPQRIVSLGLCTDQLLLMMVDHTRIAAITKDSKDPFISYMAAQTADVENHNTTAEDIIRHQPDLVVSTSFGSPDTIRILKRLGYRVEVIPLPTKVDDIYPLLRQFGAWLGENEKAEAMVSSVRQRIAATEATLANVPAETAVMYSPNGLVIGGDTLEDDILHRAGYRNLAAEAGIKFFQAISLETLMLWKPEKILLENGVNNRDSLAHAYIYHPAIRDLVGAGNTVEMPPHLRDCFGPMTADFIAYLATKHTPALASTGGALP